MAYVPQSGSVVAFEGGPWTTSVVGTVFVAGSVATIGSATANQSVSGTVGASIIGLPPVNIVGTPSISGAVTIVGATIPPGSVSGSVGIVGTPSISGQVGASVIGVVPIAQSGTIVVSVVGGYAEDLPSTSGDQGVFVLGVRNDTVASLVSTSGDYGAFTNDSAGRVLIKPFSPDESRLDTTSSVTSSSITSLFPSVVGLRNYVTDVMVANTGSVATLIIFKDGSTSILGYTIAPAGGGSNITGMNMPFRTAPAQDFVFQSSIASSVLYVTAKGYKAP